MKTGWIVAAALSVAVSLSLPLTAKAEEGIAVYIKNDPVAFESPPLIENGVTLVPFRPVFEKMGLSVSWDGAAQKVTGTRLGTRIELRVGSRSAVINGESTQLEAAPQLIGGSVFVPLRFVGEAAAYNVEWVQSSRSVLLQPTKAALVLDKLAAADGKALYQGELANGCPNGQGVFRLPGQLSYDGGWKSCRFDGAGTLYWPNGTVEYKGDFVQGRKQGKGSYYSPNGALLYEGDFRQDKMEGEGRFFSASGSVVYEGQVRDGEQAGQGRLLYGDGRVNYEGEFAGGKPEGQGKLYDEQGSLIFAGRFTAGSPDGVQTASEIVKADGSQAWNVLETAHFKLYYLQDDARIRELAGSFDAIYNAAYARYGHAPALKPEADGKIPVYFLAGDRFVQALGASYDNMMGQWYDGTMFMNLKSLHDADGDMPLRILRHELIHAMTLSAADSTSRALPAWFVEGAASLHDYDAPLNRIANAREAAVRQAVQDRRLMTWSELAASPSAWGADRVLTGYGEAWSIWQYLSVAYGEDKLLRLFYAGGSGDFAAQLTELTGKSLSALEADWLVYVNSTYTK